MKIGLVCPYSINKHGGVLEIVLMLRDGMVARGHEVKIITPKPRGHVDEPDKDVIFFGTSTDFRTLSFGETTSQVSSTAENQLIDEILNKERFDILHFHEPWNPLLSRQLLQRSRSVNIATFHAKVSDAITTRSVLKVVNPYLKSVMKYLHVLTAVSPSGAEFVSTMTEQPITIIPNGIDLQKYSNLPQKDDAKPGQTILFIGRLEKRKGTMYLLQAYAELLNSLPDARLLIAGDGPERERLELLAEDLKLPNVDFLGYVEESEKLRLLANADLFCSPALYGESFGIVLLEAMASSTVAIAGNNSGYADLMQGLGQVSVVNPADIPEFARRLRLLLTEPDLRKLWQDWAKDYVHQFDYPAVVDQYEALYTEALKQYGQ
ncbi:MAG TPA: glycosyltransferase family 4 protein [Candidatus Saccharimonadales bacterium]|nr:glycosyltransferase family 4 protein [Candidatus Saccharimonadales bacterium]